jgi:hypothetical protein
VSRILRGEERKMRRAPWPVLHGMDLGRHIHLLVVLLRVEKGELQRQILDISQNRGPTFAREDEVYWPMRR